MRVTSIHHMYPGTTQYEATIFGHFDDKGFVEERKILSWPYEEQIFRGFTKLFCDCVPLDHFSMDDAGIPFCTHNKHATFTTREEAEEYLGRFVK